MVYLQIKLDNQTGLKGKHIEVRFLTRIVGKTIKVLYGSGKFPSVFCKTFTLMDNNMQLKLQDQHKLKI